MVERKVGHSALRWNKDKQELETFDPNPTKEGKMERIEEIREFVRNWLWESDKRMSRWMPWNREHTGDVELMILDYTDLLRNELAEKEVEIVKARAELAKEAKLSSSLISQFDEIKKEIKELRETIRWKGIPRSGGPL